MKSKTLILTLLVVAMLAVPAVAIENGNDIPEIATLYLSPESATNIVGETHVLTAKLTWNQINGDVLANFDGNDGIPGQTVIFKVTDGPNAGLTGSNVTDANGIATWDYSSSLTGEDTIQAFVTLQLASETREMTVNCIPEFKFESNPVTKIWKEPAIPEFPTMALPIAAVLGLAFVFKRRK
ncbi:PEF-CTERM sorting domain-containing protein [Methanolobus zinderi]|nr:PEF-CTERM sorting domain-containing protein [Methanolobus zinderi]